MDNANNIHNLKSETQDFMNVQSFSQLPFIRPAPVKPDKPIRLFGIEFSDNLKTNQEDKDKDRDNNNNGSGGSGEDASSNGRRFECHYCCRNFPTSQALGGHQNAHKRERQHAKRAHLHSAMSLADHHHHHVYGLLNYHRLSSPATTTSYYPSWTHHHNNNVSTSTPTRFYGTTAHHAQPPINGSPLALWRIPAVHSNANPTLNRDRSSSLHRHHQTPLLFAGDPDRKPLAVVGSGGSSSQATRYVYESKPSVQDNVSLDLHL